MVKYQKTIEQIAGLAVIGGIVIGCGFVLRPFISAILWAAILCFATWPLYELFRRWLHGRRTLAAALMTAVLSLVLIIPFVVAGLTFTNSIRSVMAWLDPKDEIAAVPSDPVEPVILNLLDPAGEAEMEPADPNEPAAAETPESDPQATTALPGSSGHTILPPRPEWVDRIPLVGTRISENWDSMNQNAELTLNTWKPWLKSTGRWLLLHSLDFAHGLLQLAMSVLIAFFLYRDGEGLVIRLREGLQRISGDTAQRLVDVVKTTVQSVVYGVIGTALAQGIVAGIGFIIAGVPEPMLLALLTFFLSFVPFGPPIVWISAALWLFGMGQIGWGIFMTAYGMFVISLVDNVIKPLIISRGSKLSFIVMFIGVIGGVTAFGFIGIFLGPTLLAVGFSLAQEILEQRRYHSARTLATTLETPQNPPASVPDSAPVQ
jgi:predicted PurR-regulated permease PerM